MPKASKTLGPPTLIAALLVLALILVACTRATNADTSPGSQVTFTNQDPNGQGTSTLSVFYDLPQQVQVGGAITVPIRLEVDDLTKLMAFVQDYNVSVSVDLNDGKQLSGQVGVTAVEAAANNGSLQLRAGQGWGVVNITIPLTQANTGLSQGKEALGNVTLKLNADVRFDAPVNGSRPVEDQKSIGYTIVADGIPAGPRPNFVGFALVGLGVVIFVVAMALRPRGSKRSRSERQGTDTRLPKKPPGSV